MRHFSEVRVKQHRLATIRLSDAPFSAGIPLRFAEQRQFCWLIAKPANIMFLYPIKTRSISTISLFKSTERHILLPWVIERSVQRKESQSIILLRYCPFWLTVTTYYLHKHIIPLFMQLVMLILSIWILNTVLNSCLSLAFMISDYLEIVLSKAKIESSGIKEDITVLDL